MTECPDCGGQAGCIETERVGLGCRLTASGTVGLTGIEKTGVPAMQTERRTAERWPLPQPTLADGRAGEDW